MRIEERTDLPKDQIIAEYRSGGSIRAMRVKYKIKDENLKKLLCHWGVELREDPSAKGKEATQVFTKELLFDLYITRRLSCDQIGRMYKVHPDTVLKHINKHQLQYGNKQYYDRISQRI